MKYRKGDKIVEAFQWKDDPLENYPDWFLENVNSGLSWLSADGLKIDTMDAIELVQPGDYIVQGVGNEVRPCKPDIFAQAYERVGE